MIIVTVTELPRMQTLLWLQTVVVSFGFSSKSLIKDLNPNGGFSSVSKESFVTQIELKRTVKKTFTLGNFCRKVKSFTKWR